MGRFFQASDSKYVDDFIYTPPWELIAGITQKQDQNVQTSLDTMEVMRNLPINYWKGVDDERAKAVQDEWAQKVQDVAQKVSKDYLNPANRAELMNLKSQLNKDVTSGNISKLQANALAGEQWEAARKALPNPADREIYQKQLEFYKRDNKDGAYTSIFKPDEMYNTTDYWDKYMQSDTFKNLKADMGSSSVENINGRWMVKNGSQLEELSKSKIGQNFQVWLKQQTDLPMYAQNRSKYNNENWLDEKGNISFDEGTMAGDMMINGVSSMAYKRESKTKDLAVNQVAENDASRAHQTSERQASQAYQDKVRREERAYETMKAAREGKNSGLELIVGNDKNTKIFNSTIEGKQSTIQYLKEINGIMSLPGVFINKEDEIAARKSPITWALKTASNPNKPAELRNHLLQINGLYSSKAGVNKLVSLGLNDKQIKQITDGLNSKITNNLIAKNKGYLTTDEGFHLLGSQQVSLPTLKGRTFRDSDGQTKQIYDVEVLENSNFIGAGDLLSSKVRVYTGVPSTAGMGKTNSLGKPDKNSYIDFDFNQSNRSNILTFDIPNY